MDGLLGFAGGVMLSVTTFGLLLPAFDKGGVGEAVLGLALGAGLLAIVDRTVPHFHFLEGPEGPRLSLQRTWLIVLALTIHNFPEGLAVGVTFGRNDIDAGIILAIGIGIQNMPEGLAVSLPLVREGYKSGEGHRLRHPHGAGGAGCGAPRRLARHRLRAAVAHRAGVRGGRNGLRAARRDSPRELPARPPSAPRRSAS